MDKITQYPARASEAVASMVTNVTVTLLRHAESSMTEGRREEAYKSVRSAHAHLVLAEYWRDGAMMSKRTRRRNVKRGASVGEHTSTRAQMMAEVEEYFAGARDACRWDDDEAAGLYLADLASIVEELTMADEEVRGSVSVDA